MNGKLINIPLQDFVCTFTVYHLLSLQRHNRTRIRKDLYIIGALKTFTGCCKPGIEDDVISGLGVSSLNEVKMFTRLQMEDCVIQSRLYKRVSRRNTFTVAYKEKNALKYGQIEVFVKASAPDHKSNMEYGAVLFPLEKIPDEGKCITDVNEVLGINPIGDFVAAVKPPQMDRCTLIGLDQISEVCVYMEFKPSKVAYIARLPNAYERD